MSSIRRHVSLGLALGLVCTAFASYATAADAPAPIQMPATGCVTFTDPKGDSSPPWGNDADLDITWATFASPPGKIRAFIHVDALGSPTLIGHVFDATFQLNGKPASIIGGEDGAGFDSVPRDPFGKPLASVTYDAAAVPDAIPDVVFDQAKSTVILTVDRAPLEKASKGSLADGVTVTGVSVHSTGDAYASRISADSAPKGVPPEQSTYTLGDNHCFTPPAAKLAVTAPSKAVAGHTVKVTGTLTDEAGKAKERTVHVAIGSVSTNVVTDATGAYAANLRLDVPAGAYDVTATFAGDDTLPTATATTKTVVSLQPTKTTLTSKASGSSVVLTAQLVDDLGAPLAGKTVTWTVDGKGARTAKTDAKGHASFTSPPKHTVRAVFAGQTGRYGASQASRAI